MRKTLAAAIIATALVSGSAGAAIAVTVTHESGSYCKIVDHGKTGVNKAGKAMVCKSYTAWHWVRQP